NRSPLTGRRRVRRPAGRPGAGICSRSIGSAAAAQHRGYDGSPPNRGGGGPPPPRLRRASCFEPAEPAKSCEARRAKQDGAQERTRTFTAVKPLAPEASASTNSATWARSVGSREPASL